MIELSGESVIRITSFLDVEALFPAFGLPLELPAQGQPEPGSGGPRGA